ncbi:MAG: tRNA preQ1(34) S-adenosylmethionine ribosyltransferase-isomerase QueA [Ruminococcaceae bacterium]|nr:tRNA preQ1(34) S-adenosylmethionine ribosyltransferase-isomerase QueA [Oscillospiraceae bacterium]
MKRSDFFYDLPEELIAQTPLLQRDSSRMLVLSRESGEIAHRHFHDITEYLRPGDCIVLNESRVIPARLIGVSAKTGSPVEILLLTQRGDEWECITRPGKRTREGARVKFGDELEAEVTGVTETGNRIVRFHYDGIFMEVLEQLGKMPLPPYITEELDDASRYQTVYSKNPGSAAAPTAGFHFTPELLAKIEEMGVKIARVTLHVGLGTFRPVKADEITDHVMHAEYYEVPQEAADTINAARAAGGRIISVGTTSTRTLESVAEENGHIPAASGWTSIFIYPGYRFRAIDGLITNFHLPESTLIMLVSAFAGYDHTMAAYHEAVRERYRFFSFGDSMLIL